MKHILLIGATITLSLFSCQNKDNNQQTTIETPNSPYLEPPKLIQKSSPKSTYPDLNKFNWEMPNQLKEKTLQRLKDDPSNSDKIVLNFLKKYEERIIDEFRRTLHSLKSIDSLNTLAYAPDGIVYPNALAFKQLIQKYGLSISSEEGMLDIAPNANYITKDISDLVDRNTVRFLRFYAEETNQKCCEDGGINISKDELIKRTFQWGNLLETSQARPYKDIVEGMFNRYLNLVFEGLDNTPAFALINDKYDKELFKNMKAITKSYPNTKVAQEFKNYISLLEQSNFTKNQQIKTYLRNKFETDFIDTDDSERGDLIEDVQIILNEKSLNSFPLPLPQKDMLAELESFYVNSEVKRKTGQQDGPNFRYIEIADFDGPSIALLNFNPDNEHQIDQVILTNSYARDEYGVRVGDSYQTVLDKRKAAFTSDFYQGNISLRVTGSHIYYKLVGNVTISAAALENIENFELPASELQKCTVERIIWDRHH